MIDKEMASDRRLIEVAFPLEQASIDSLHEKSVRHGHLSTLHIWPARRPLAACRATLLAALLADPGSEGQRRAMTEKIGGKVVKALRRQVLPGGAVDQKEVRETVGGLLHWGRENGPDLEVFRERIREQFGGRAPRVLDPFAGGGAIPLEAMRLGCDVTASDLNPVAWLILKATLEYPQRLGGQTRPLPPFVLRDIAFMEAFLKHKGLGKAAIRTQLERLGLSGTKGQAPLELAATDLPLEADLAWHVSAWGKWVLARARKELAERYPLYADFEPVAPNPPTSEKRPMRLVPLDADGLPDEAALNAEFDAETLKDRRNPRWIVKPPVAYLWARTVRCKACGGTLPLLKTRWLCKTDRKRILLTMESDGSGGLVFEVEANVPQAGGNSAQRREHDKRIGAGTMSGSGSKCPHCPAINTSEDLRIEGRAGRIGAVMTAVITDGQKGKEYRRPTDLEIERSDVSETELCRTFADAPFGMPDEPIPEGASRSSGGGSFTVFLYGLRKWKDLFTARQLQTVGILLTQTRLASEEMRRLGYPLAWNEAISVYLALTLDRLADYSSSICSWSVSRENVRSTFGRFALPIVWDYCEVYSTSETSGGYPGALEWVVRFLANRLGFSPSAATPTVIKRSATKGQSEPFDVVATDPPYYDAIQYSDLMDFFYVWLRRTLWGLTPEIDQAFATPLSPKWDVEAEDGELIDDAGRFGGDADASKKAYEAGMYRAFRAARDAMTPQGRFIVVFAHKQPDAWETLVSAMIRAGLVVDASWPIQTERGARARALSSAALASSVWLVCRKRPDTARPGWDNQVLADMEERIGERMRAFWDAGISGPDFVWAATGPALEAYSRYPVVKKADSPNETLPVHEFLQHVRRFVMEFVVGRMLGEEGEVAESLDGVSTFYLLHRKAFGLGDAPAGACILYAVSCGLSDHELEGQYDLITRSRSTSTAEVDAGEDSEDGDQEEETATAAKGSTVKLKAWKQRRRRGLGVDAPGGQSVPLIDQAHKLMQLWRAGDVVKVNEYLDTRGLRRSTIFGKLLQALIELAPAGDEERNTLESLSKHLDLRGRAKAETIAVALE